MLDQLVFQHFNESLDTVPSILLYINLNRPCAMCVYFSSKNNFNQIDNVIIFRVENFFSKKQEKDLLN